MAGREKNGALIRPSLGSFDGLAKHQRCEVCPRCVACNSLQCGSRRSERRCLKHPRKKKAGSS